MNSRTSATTWLERLLRASNIVSTMPWIDRSGLSVVLTCSTVCNSCDNPSSAKNSHCSGTRMALDAAGAGELAGVQRRDRGAQTERAVARLAEFELEAGQIHGRRRDRKARHCGGDDSVAQRRFADQDVVGRDATV